MTVDKRTLALGIAAAAAVAAAVTVTVFDRSPGPSRERRAVTAYIHSVDAIQNQMHVPLTRVMLAYRHFAGSGKTEEAVAPELASAAASLTTLGRRLAAVPPPPQARAFRARLVTLVRRQAEITREVQEIAAFSAPFARILARAHAANAALGVALRAVTIPRPHTLRGTKKAVRAAQRAYKARADAAASAQADAVDAYDAAISVVLTRLARLHPPLVFRPAYAAQVRAFRAIRAAGTRLADDLRRTNRGNIAVLGRRFQTAARIAQTVEAQRAEITAIKSYNARARAVSAAAGDVSAELARLQRTLP